MTQKENVSKYHYDNIQLWRVISVFSVFFCHLAQRTLSPGPVRNVIESGALGVELFFIISGFLAIKHFDGKSLTKALVLDYYKNRAIRILPLYYFSILFFFILHTVVLKNVPRDPTGLGWIRYIIVFVSGNVRSGEEYYDFWTNVGAVWSICVFATFYLLVPFISRFVRSFNKAILFAVVFWSVRLILSYRQFPYMHTLTYFVFFGLGMMLWYANQERKEHQFCFVIGCIVGCNILFSRALDTNDELMLAACGFSLFLLATMGWRVQSTKRKRWLSIIDKYSYSVYLSQGVVFCGIVDQVHGMPKIAVFMVSIIGTGALSYLLYDYYEQPIQRVLTGKQYK